MAKRKKTPKYLRDEQGLVGKKACQSNTLSEPAIQYLEPQRLLSATLSSLLKERWEGEIPSPEDSYPVRHLYALYNTRISEYTIEDFRFLINQNIALEHIMPLALEILTKNIFASGDFYDGDLLNAALTVPDSFWKENPLMYASMKELLERQKDSLDSNMEIKSVRRTISDFLNTNK